MGDMINDTIDWEMSENERRVTVRQRIDDELDGWKRIYHGLDSLLVSCSLLLLIDTLFSHSSPN